VLIAAGIIFGIRAAWIFRPYLHAEESLSGPRLRALKQPYRSVYSGVVFDDGSGYTAITDATG
jgi:hypothetical protein